MAWSVETWMTQNRDVVEKALAQVEASRLLVPERAFLAYAMVAFDARLVDGSAVDGGERSAQ